MTYIILIYFILILYGIRLRKNTNDYLNKDSTNNIKGIFAIMILLSHFSGYVSIDSSSIYEKVIRYFNQLMVTIFLFYSGYGIMESIKNKKNYMKSFLSRRFLKTLIHFDLAVIIYAILNLILGNKYKITTYLLSLIGWSSIGNSNWFIFVILVLYLITYISNLLTPNKKITGIIITTILSLLLIVILYKFKEPWWYNTILCYPCGLWYSYFKEKIEKYILSKHKYISVIIILIIFLITHKYSRIFITYELLSCIFCLLIVNITYIFSVGNKVLHFIGIYSFEIYILQRLSYIFFSKLPINNAPLYFVISATSTITISILFKYLTNYIDKQLFKNTKKA